MKHIYKIFTWVLLINLVVLSGLQAGVINKVTKTVLGKKAPAEYAGTAIGLELWNKEPKSIRVKITTIDGDISPEGIEVVQPGGLLFKKTGEIDSIYGRIDYSAHFYVNFYDDNNQVKDIYDIDPQNKTVYVRSKIERGNRIFGPETGALKGIVRSTDTGLSLKNNITDKNIRKLTDAQVAATRDRSAEPDSPVYQKTAPESTYRSFPPQSILGISAERQPTNITMAEAYKILQLKPGATKSDAVRSWKQLSLKWHPDKVSDEQKPVAEEIFKFITAAKDLIK